MTQPAKKTILARISCSEFPKVSSVIKHQFPVLRKCIWCFLNQEMWEESASRLLRGVQYKLG